MVIQILNKNGEIFALGRASSMLQKLVPFQPSERSKLCDHANYTQFYFKFQDPLLIQQFKDFQQKSLGAVAPSASMLSKSL